MKRIKVLVSHSNVREEDLALIAGVDPSVDAVRALFADESSLKNIQILRSNGDQFLSDLKEYDFERHAAEAEVILGGLLPRNIIIWLRSYVGFIPWELEWRHSLGRASWRMGLRSQTPAGQLHFLSPSPC